MSKLVPFLRFPEFKDSGEWVEKKLGDVAKITTGKSNREDSSLDGEFTFFDRSEDIRSSSIYLFDCEAVIVAGEGQQFIPKYFVGKFDLHQRTYAIMNFNYVVGLFVYYLVHVKQSYFLAQAVGSTVKSLRLPIFENMPVSLPSLPEQTKIATFLTSIDDRIEALSEQLELTRDYKKGMMQRIFSKQLRFKDDEGNEYPEWVEKKLGEILDYLQPIPYLVSSTEYDNSYDVPVLTAGKTFILGYTNEENGVFDKNLPVIIFDDFTTDSKFVDFPFKAKSSAMKILIGRCDVSVKFIYEAMQQIKYEIGGHGRHWISVFSQIDVLFPSLPEQTKIATFLSSIDDRIEALSEQLEQTKLFKKAMLQRVLV
jgi:type I restriction enzyme S subunit